jgi:hypothetical protein
MRNHPSESAPAFPDRYCQAWRLYPTWGKLLAEPADDEIPDAAYEAIKQVTATFQSLAEREKGHLADLLKESDLNFAPLSDPLRLGFRGHRWLDPRREREENYSDWLAWLLERMDSTEHVLQVFGLENTAFGALVRGREFYVSREEPIPIPSGGRKRTDIVIRFGDAVLLVEVKIRDLAVAGGADNLKLYLEWLETQSDGKRRCAVLLLPQSMESPCLEWEVRTWEDVSLALRRQAAQKVKEQREPLLLAITLCFAGAVEQNILGLDGTGAGFSAPQTALYLDQFLKEVNHGTTTVPA